MHSIKNCKKNYIIVIYKLFLDPAINMPCSKCQQSVTCPQISGCRVRYCVCGLCNHCHLGGICPDGNFWYKKAKKNATAIRAPYTSGQSHGGHNYVPGCNKHQ